MTDCDGLITNLRNANNAARIDLEAIKARVARATEGPWYRDGAAIWQEAHDGEIILGNVPRGGSLAAVDDLEFMARARADIPALIAEVERLRAIEARP